MYEYEFRDRLVSGTYRDAFRAPAGTGKPHRVVPHRQVPGRKRDRCERRKKGWRTHGSQSGNPCKTMREEERNSPRAPPHHDIRAISRINASRVLHASINMLCGMMPRIEIAMDKKGVGCE
ncbi:hypothetical protein ALC57_06003 [Trachymyrmex cornetzi]|uniref:Uncharacterized protein n=1 Tax=Trachymyrmex cornetzi TaxID=471704 RepID=A0A151J9D0_9HYME|nr:hypothetical protein ALC57_06003 [Trachymyrmex cornetzi]